MLPHRILQNGSFMTSRMRKIVALLPAMLLPACDSATEPETEPCSSITMQATSINPRVGETSTISASAVDAGGVAIQGVVIAFTSANPGVAVVDGTGRLSALSAGTTVVTATAACGRDGAIVSTPLTI